VTPFFLLHVSFSWVEISLHVEFHPLGLPRGGRFMVGDKKATIKFLSLQHELRLELGLRLRLTNI
jgi:hypothetical protein